MNTEKSVLYKLELKYPWRKLLRGIYILTVATWFLMFAIPAWAYYVWHSVSTTFFINSIILLTVLYLVLTYIMRYLLIHVDKIQAPIKVKVTPEMVYYEKGRYKKEFCMDGLKTAKIYIDDKIAYIETNYEKDSEWYKGWRLGFKRKNELANVNYKEFINNTFLPMVDIIVERLKDLNPQIKIDMYDNRRRYR